MRHITKHNYQHTPKDPDYEPPRCEYSRSETVEYEGYYHNPEGYVTMSGDQTSPL